jgi:hypothetical protein
MSQENPNGETSLKALFDGEEPQGIASMDIEELAYVISRGGWPASIGMPKI